MTDSNTDRNEPQMSSTFPFEPPGPAAGAQAPAAAWERATLEKLAFAALKEQRAARRWKIFLRLAWLAFFCALLWLGLSRGPSTTTNSKSHTAVIEIKGEIANDNTASAESIISAMKTAFTDEGAKGLVLLINSPGGSPVQAGMVTDEIKRMRAKYGKPVYAVVEETCASAAYYIASATDKIFVNKASMVGSIGVLMDSFGFTGVMNKVGVERRLLISGEHKNFLDPFSPMNDAERAHAQRMLDQIHEQFIGAVKAGRGDRLKTQTPDLFSGLVWTGEEAVDIGLADQLGGVDYVAREVIKAEELVDYTQRDNIAERLAKKFSTSMVETMLRIEHRAPSLR